MSDKENNFILPYTDEFIAVIADIHGYFAEYQDNRCLLRSICQRTKNKIYALGMGAETIELLNFDILGSYS